MVIHNIEMASTHNRTQSKEAIDHIEIDIRLIADHVQEKTVWALTKAAYSAMLIQNDDWELAETYFNSITRRIFATVGVDAEIEFESRMSISL